MVLVDRDHNFLVLILSVLHWDVSICLGHKTASDLAPFFSCSRTSVTLWVTETFNWQRYQRHTLQTLQVYFSDVFVLLTVLIAYW